MDGFTQKYRINRLVYWETFQYAGNAISREKVIKDYARAKKVALIERNNPTWDDLAEEWGKPLTSLKVVAPQTKAGPSLRSG
jgi:putative endonuclease